MERFFFIFQSGPCIFSKIHIKTKTSQKQVKEEDLKPQHFCFPKQLAIKNASGLGARHARTLDTGTEKSTWLILCVQQGKQCCEFLKDVKIEDAVWKSVGSTKVRELGSESTHAQGDRRAQVN